MKQNNLNHRLENLRRQYTLFRRTFLSRCRILRYYDRRIHGVVESDPDCSSRVDQRNKHYPELAGGGVNGVNGQGMYKHS